MTQPRNRVFVLSDLVLLPFAVLISFALRLDGFNFFGYERSFLVFTALATIIPPFVFLLLGVYARYWRYASVEDVRLLSVAVAVAVLLISGCTVVALRFFPTGLVSLLTLRFTTGTPVLPRSIPFIFFLLALPAAALPRLAVRLLAGYAQDRNREARTRAVVMGAGDAGVVIVRELKRNARSTLEIVGFLDDDPRKRAMRIHGLPVVGSRDDIPRVVEEYALDQVIVAMPSAPGKTIRTIVQICEGAGVRTKIMPGIHELLDDSVSINQLRDVQIEDLLRREPIQTDIAAVTELVRGKRVLVTGGGGSIGSELCRQLLRCGPGTLVVVGHGENSVFHIVNELQLLARSPLVAQEHRTGDRIAAPTTKIAAVIADIRFADRIQAVFAEHQPEIVFHAAAHKHVTLMELNPAEAITNNVLGTKNLVEAAVAANVQQFVMISTDKAVNPTNIMGASKRAAELLVHRAARQSGRAFVAVRFGNVLGSRGSVVPIFKAQIAAGGPVTVTHPEVVRYFITIPEAVQLVLQAATLGRGGEVFVLDMGEPVKIIDLAKDLIELSGLEVGRDIDIVFKGLQPGEKLYEEMFVHGETYARTQHRQIFLADAGRFVPLRLDEAVGVLAAAVSRHDTAAIIEGLRQLVPEFEPTRESVVVEQHRAERA